MALSQKCGWPAEGPSSPPTTPANAGRNRIALQRESLSGIVSARMARSFIHFAYAETRARKRSGWERQAEEKAEARGFDGEHGADLSCQRADQLQSDTTVFLLV